MALKQSKKAKRVADRKAVFNVRRNRHMKEVVKEVRELVKSGKAGDATQKLPEAYKAIDKATKRGVIKANTASRKKSRLSALIRKAEAK